ncbi:hypothetical protein ACWOBZ_01150 [Gemella bergeri]
MDVIVYLTIFLIPTLFFIKYYKDYKITKLKYEIIATIDFINSLNKENLLKSKFEYPEFYKIIKSIFNKDLEITKFKQVDKQVSEKLNYEINLAIEKEEILEFILPYRKLCILIYLHRNFNKYLLVELLMKILPEKESKELKEREEEKASDLCLA